MAKTLSNSWRPERHKKITSIGNSTRSRYNNKNQKKMGKKRYRGQGK